MKKTYYLLIVIGLVVLIGLSACGGQSAAPAGSTSTRPQPPADYANQKNPHAGDAASADAGKQTFQANCAACHGDTGKGDGPSSATLDPKPADLAVNVKSLSDGYLLWRISEGGAMAPFNSAMPSWKTNFSTDQIWQLVTFLRTLGQ